MKKGCAPEYLTEQLKYFGEVQPYNLRNALDFRPPRADTNSMQVSLFSIVESVQHVSVYSQG